MDIPQRRHVELRGLPAYLRYPIAISIVMIVVLLVLAGPRRAAPGWFTVVTRVGAVALLVVGTVRLVRRVLSRP